MKTLKDLTPEISKKIIEYKKNCINDLYSGKEYEEYNKKNTEKYINYIYDFCKKKLPIIIIANNPKEYKYYFNFIFNSNLYNKKINSLFLLKNQMFKNNEEKDYLKSIVNEKIKVDKDFEFKNKIKQKHHWLFLTSEYSRIYLTWYKFIMNEFKIKVNKKDQLDWLFNNVKQSSIAKCYLTEKVVLVLRMPKKILRNNIGFHSTKEPAIQYDKLDKYYINGRNIPNWVFEKYFKGELTFDDFINEKNEDIKAGIITLIKENEGNKKLLKFLNAKLIDEKTIVHNDEYKETIRLYKTKEKYSFLQNHKGEFNNPFAWTEMICPSTGQSYLIDTSAAFDNVLDSIKFHRPSKVPFDLDYKWLSAN